MLKHKRKMYWKSRDRGHEIRFILMTEFFIGVIIVAIFASLSVYEKKHLEDLRQGFVTGSAVSGEAVTGSSVSGTAVIGTGTDGSVSGTAATGSAGSPGSEAPKTGLSEAHSPDSATSDPTSTEGIYPGSTDPRDESSTDTPTSGNSTTIDGIDISSMTQLLSFMNDSDYDTLIHQVIALAKIHGSNSATLLPDYQDIGETDFDVIKYVKLDDDTIIACNINLDRSGVGATISDKSLAKLKAEAKAKEKASGTNAKKAKEATKKKSKHKSKKSKSKRKKHAKR